VVGKRNGRPRKRGAKLPAPEAIVRQTPRTPLEVAWYGGTRRHVTVVSGVGQWYQSGEGLVPVRWVFIPDETGTHRDDSFFSTDPAMTPPALIETFTGRWSLENSLHGVLDVTFDEDRSRIKKDNAPESFALLRRLALCLLKQETSSKRSIKGKRLRASWDGDYLLQVLCGEAEN